MVTRSVVKNGSHDKRFVIISSRRVVVLGRLSSFGILHRVVVWRLHFWHERRLMLTSFVGSRWRTGEPIIYMRLRICSRLSFSSFMAHWVITATIEAASSFGLMLFLVAQKFINCVGIWPSEMSGSVLRSNRGWKDLKEGVYESCSGMSPGKNWQSRRER